MTIYWALCVCWLLYWVLATWRWVSTRIYLKEISGNRWRAEEWAMTQGGSWKGDEVACSAGAKKSLKPLWAQSPMQTGRTRLRRLPVICLPSFYPFLFLHKFFPHFKAFLCIYHKPILHTQNHLQGGANNVFSEVFTFQRITLSTKKVNTDKLFFKPHIKYVL